MKTAAENVLHLEGPVVEQLIGVDDALGAATQASALAVLEPIKSDRVELEFPNGFVRMLVCAIASLDVIGYKEFHLVNGVVRYLCHLHRLSTGEPLAVVDAAAITGLRTAAHAAIAVHHTMTEPLQLAVIGSGHEASQGLRLLDAVADIESVAVYSRREESRTRFARSLGTELGLDIRCAATIEEALATANIAYAATNSAGRVVLGVEDIRRLTMLVSIGSTLPSQRELDAIIFGEAGTLVYDTVDAFESSGDLIAAFPDRQPPKHAVQLGHYLASTVQRRPFVLYKSIGSAEQDVVLAVMAYEQAIADHVGTWVRSPSTVRRLR